MQDKSRQKRKEFARKIVVGKAPRSPVFNNLEKIGGTYEIKKFK